MVPLSRNKWNVIFASMRAGVAFVFTRDLFFVFVFVIVKKRVKGINTQKNSGLRFFPFSETE